MENRLSLLDIRDSGVIVEEIKVSRRNTLSYG